MLLGAGLDTFAQRQADIASRLQIFEIDQPETQIWKQQRLQELGFGVPNNLHFVSVDFENASWWEELVKAGFNTNKPAMVACTGVSLYLTEDAIKATLKQLASLTSGSKLAMTFYLPVDLMEEVDQPLQKLTEKGTREAGTPFVSFFTIPDIIALGNEAGFKQVETVSTQDLGPLYFAGRTDALIPASGEVFLLAST